VLPFILLSAPVFLIGRQKSPTFLSLISPFASRAYGILLPLYHCRFLGYNENMEYQTWLIIIGLVVLAYYMFMPRREVDFNLMGSQEKRIEKTLEYLTKKNQINNKIYRKLTRVSQSQATRDFDAMEELGLIEQVVKGRHTFYRRKH